MEPLFQENQIPENFSDDEKIIRGIFYPANFKKDVLIKNMFSPPAGSNELSVLRLNYSSANRCKFHLKKIQKGKRNYWGMAVMNKTDITAINGCRLIKTSVQCEGYFLPEHADIIVPFSKPVAANNPLPIEDDLIVEQLFDIARVKQDPFPESENWNGEELV